MPKEMPLFRFELEQLKERFPGKTVLTKKEVMEYTGRKEYWVNSHGFKGSNFSIVKVADILSRL